MKSRLGALLVFVMTFLVLAAVACESTPASPSPTEPATPSTATVTGTVTYRERIALAPNAVVEVKLIDISRADAPAVTVGEQVIENPGQVPIAFEIEYDPSKIDERFTYAVQARIMEGDRLAFINDTRYAVITRGSPTHVDMVLIKVGAAPSEPTPPEPKMVDTPAPIESVNVAVSDSNPPEYTLQIVSGLPSGCVEFKEYVTSRQGNTVTVTVTNLKPADPVPCTTNYGYHQSEVALGSDLTPGEGYTVVLNGEVTNSFTARDPEGPEMITKESPIERIEVLTLESDPPQYRLKVLSRLPRGSSCSSFNGYEVSRPFADTIQISVTHLEVAETNARCTRDLPVVETSIPLGADFKSGEEYTVTVNDQITETFKAQ